jgi:hypothetical protein
MSQLAKPEGDMGTDSAVVIRERMNWLIAQYYVRQEFTEALEVIERQLAESNGMCEYAIYVKGLIKRHQGQVKESLTLFQAATCLNPQRLQPQAGRAVAVPPRAPPRRERRVRRGAEARARRLGGLAQQGPVPHVSAAV